MAINIELEDPDRWPAFRGIDLAGIRVLSIYIERDGSMTIGEALTKMSSLLADAVNKSPAIRQSIVLLARNSFGKPENRLKELEIERFSFAESINRGVSAEQEREGSARIQRARGLGGPLVHYREFRIVGENLHTKAVFLLGEVENSDLLATLRFLNSTTAVCVIGSGIDVATEELPNLNEWSEIHWPPRLDLVKYLLSIKKSGGLIVYPFGTFDDREVGFTAVGELNLVRELRDCFEPDF